MPRYTRSTAVSFGTNGFITTRAVNERPVRAAPLSVSWADTERVAFAGAGAGGGGVGAGGGV